MTLDEMIMDLKEKGFISNAFFENGCYNMVDDVSKYGEGKHYEEITYERNGKTYKRVQLVGSETKKKNEHGTSLHELNEAPAISNKAAASFTKDYIRQYVDTHPEIKKEVPKYRGYLDKIKKFNNVKREDGTYDLGTGKKVDLSSGFQVTFHQNKSMAERFGAYSDEEYATMIAITMKEIGADKVYCGNFGNAEISFTCNDEKIAKRFCEEQNQHSLWKNEKQEIWENPKYNKKTNPTEAEN